MYTFPAFPFSSATETIASYGTERKNDNGMVETRHYCYQHNKRGDASVRLVGITNPQQIEVMEFEFIVAVFGDGNCHQRERGFSFIV